LYDLAIDPNEKHNLFRAGKPLVLALWEKLEAWSRVTPPRYSNDQFPSGKAAKALESLGYAR